MVVYKIVEPFLKPLVYAAVFAVILQLMGVDVFGLLYDLVVDEIVDRLIVW